MFESVPTGIEGFRVAVSPQGGGHADARSADPQRIAAALKLRNRDRGRAFRNRFDIHGYMGANGSGKSLCMVHDTLPSLLSGRTVLSTVPLIDARTGEPFPNYVRLSEWSQLLEAEHADVLFDEVVGIASARASQGMPIQVQNWLVKLRKKDLVLRWTAPHWRRADMIIREVTQAVTVCKGRLAANNGDHWRPKRLFRFRTFDAMDFESLTQEKIEKIDKLDAAWFWGPGSLAFASYDTLGAVERVGEVLDSGRCAHCGGRRDIPRCRCGAGADHEHGPSVATKNETPA